jgi:hypothetical protein
MGRVGDSRVKRTDWVTRDYHGLKTAFRTRAGPKAAFSAKAIAIDQIVREHIYPTLHLYYVSPGSPKSHTLIEASRTDG